MIIAFEGNCNIMELKLDCNSKSACTEFFDECHLSLKGDWEIEFSPEE